VIGKVCQRGSDVRRLLGYLFREGAAGEYGQSAPHTDAHLTARGTASMPWSHPGVTQAVVTWGPLPRR